MHRTLARALVILAGLGIPLAAGGMYVLSRKCPGDAAVCPVDGSAECCCACQVPERLQLIVALAQQQQRPARSEVRMYGGTPERNMVNTTDTGIPAEWSVEEGKQENVKWAAQLGNKAYGGPIIAGGKVYVGTNNAIPRDPKIEGQKAVLMCFDEATGRFLWQLTHDIPASPIFDEARTMGLLSTPCAEADKLYYVIPGAELVCASSDGKVVWTLDMMKELKVVPFHTANCSPVIHGDNVYVITGNGIDEESKVHNPDAASFVAVNKNTGKVAWQSNLPGNRIIEGQWANPAVAVVGGKAQVIFPGGDGVLYGLEADSGKLIWKLDCNLGKPRPESGRPVPNYFVASPAVHGDRAFIGMGAQPEIAEGMKYSYLFCVDITKTGDLTPKSLEPGKSGAVVWAFGGPIDPVPAKGRRVYFGRTISTCAIHGGLVYLGEEAGYLHCFDEKTGERYWVEDLKSPVWGSPYCVDGKVYQGTEDGSVFVFAAGKAKKRLAEVDLGEVVHTTPVVANGVLYVMTKSKLYAIAEKK